MRPTTWATLAAADARLGALRRDILAVRREQQRTPDRHFCANAVWYGEPGFKRRLVALVGWRRRQGPPELQTQEAYDVAYSTLYRLLPACADCGCVRVGRPA
jgi:hypothetical protein